MPVNLIMRYLGQESAPNVLLSPYQIHIIIRTRIEAHRTLTCSAYNGATDLVFRDVVIEEK